jgi:hypothetical protein
LKTLLNGKVKYARNALCPEGCLKTLATRNLKDFDWLEGLKIVDPFA